MMQSSKKIAILANYLSKYDGRIIKFTNALIEIGFDVDPLSFIAKDGTHETIKGGILLDWRKGAILRFPLAKVWGAIRSAPPLNISIAAAKRAIMEKHLKKNKYEYVIATDPETLLIASRAKNVGGYRLIYDAHEFFEDEVPNDIARKVWVKKTHESSAKFIDKFITVNEAIAEEYLKSEPDFPPAIVIHNAAEYDRNLQDDGRLRAKANLPKSAKILMYQGGFAKDRGLHSLVSAFNEPIGDWHLIMMGSGVLENELRAIASKSVIFLPPVPQEELKYWTAGADLGAIFYEPTCKNQLLCSPNKLWEYPAAQVPIIASDLPYLKKIIRENGIGFTIERIEEIGIALLTNELHEAKVSCLEFSKVNNCEAEFLKLKTFILSQSNHR